MIRRIAADGSVTTFAGSSGARGNTDGAGTAATFSAPLGLAIDAAGNLYVADAMNHTIRKITSAGVVSTLAGSAGVPGYADGTGTGALFNYPAGLAVDAAGNVYVADRSNNVIRKVTPAGVVTTLAGLQGVSGATDGAGSLALFNQPSGLVLDGAGNFYVTDTGNSTIRKLTPAGVVSTLAGLPTIGGNQDGTGSGAMFNQPRALTIDSAGNLYVADTGNATIRKVTPAGVVTTLTLQQGTSSASSGGGTTGGGSSSTPAGGSASTGPNGNGAGATGGWFIAGLAALSLLRWVRPRCWASRGLG
jgi:streptogramin lyase